MIDKNTNTNTNKNTTNNISNQDKFLIKNILNKIDNLVYTDKTHKTDLGCNQNYLSINQILRNVNPRNDGIKQSSETLNSETVNTKQVDFMDLKNTNKTHNDIEEYIKRKIFQEIGEIKDVLHTDFIQMELTLISPITNEVLEVLKMNKTQFDTLYSLDTEKDKIKQFYKIKIIENEVGYINAKSEYNLKRRRSNEIRNEVYNLLSKDNSKKIMDVLKTLSIKFPELLKNISRQDLFDLENELREIL